MTTHAQARELAARALSAVFRCSANPQAVRHLAGVAQLETNYGDGWKGAGRNSNNMGAIQCGSQWTGLRFEYTDTHPNADGTSTPYRIGFRKYLTPDEGWRDLVKVVYINRGRASVLAAAEAGNTFEVSRLLHATGYYEGFGRDVVERVNNHYRALARAIKMADGELVTSPAYVQGERPVLRRGARGPWVGVLQRELRLAADNIFGRVTESELVEYQLSRGLTGDGICGPASWAMLLGDEYQPEVS